MIAREALSAAGEGFWGDDALVRTRYEEHTAGKALAGSRLREDLGKEWQAAQDLFKDFATLKGSELVVISDPPGRTVTVNGKRQGETPLRVRNLQPGSAPVSVSDIWYEKSERQVALTESRSYLFLGAAKPAKAWTAAGSRARRVLRRLGSGSRGRRCRKPAPTPCSS